MDADCYFGDHDWRGTSRCRCGARLRCICGVFIREDNIDEHVKRCPVITSEVEKEHREIEASWL